MSTMELRYCDKCGGRLSSLTGDGSCPKCLLTLGLSAHLVAEDEPSGHWPERFDKYRIIRLLGEGGMGSVYLAEQLAPIRREVAIKVIKLGLNTREVVSRFQSERQALAVLDHPGIAHVYEAGSTPDGRPYFAMEYVEGVPLTDYCDQNRLPVRQRLSLFVELCEAVRHAHQKGIIHRDLKPSNVLVTDREGNPCPKIIDFGLAKPLREPVNRSHLLTRFGALVGTPEYMSPEQISGEDVDTRSDVYSLGLIFYELLCGVLPFDLDQLRSPLSSRTPRANRRRLRGELDWIATKALEQDRARRYQSVSDLAADVLRHLAGEPVSAGPQNAAYRIRKFVSRHRTGVFVAAFSVCLILGAAFLSILLYLRAEAAKIGAERAQYRAAINAAALHINAGDPDEARRFLGSCSPELRGWEWRHLMYRSDPSLAVAPGSALRAAGVRRRASLAISAGGLVWNTRNALEQWSANGLNHRTYQSGGEVLAIDDAGQRAVSRAPDGRLTLYSLDPLRAVSVLDPHRNEIITAAFDAGSNRLAAASSDGQVQIWDLTYGKLVQEWRAHGGPVASILFFPDGRRLATGGEDGHVHVWDRGTGQLDFTVSESASADWPLAVTPTSRWLAFASRDSGVDGQDIRVRIYDLRRRTIIRSYPSQGAVAAVAFNAPIGLGSQYGFVNRGGELQVCCESDGCTVLKRRTHDPLNSIAFGLDGAVVYTGSDSGEIAAWDCQSRGGSAVPGRTSFTAIALDARGKRLLVGTTDPSIDVWSPLNGSTLLLHPENSLIRAIAASSDDRYAAAGDSGEIRIYDHDLKLLKTFPGRGARVTALLFRTGSPVLASASVDGTVRILDTESGRVIAELRLGAEVNALAFSSNGNSLATSSLDPKAPVRLWDARRWRPTQSFPAPVAASLVFDPRDQWLLAGAMADGAIWMQDLRTGVSAPRMIGHTAATRSLVFSPDKSRLISGSEDGAVRVWDAITWQQLLVLRGNGSPVHTVLFSPDGHKIYSAGTVIRTWSTRESVRWPDRLPRE